MFRRPPRLPAAASAARNVIGLAIIVVTFFFLGRSLAANWGDLTSEELDIRPALLVVSALPVVADVLLRSLVWSDLLGHFAGTARPPFGRLLKAFLYSWIGRYVPGKVAYLVGRFYLGRSTGLATRPLLASIAYEHVLILLGALALSSLTLVPALAVESESVLPYLVLPALVAGGVVALQPPVLRRALRLALRLLGRDDELEWLLPAGPVVRTAAVYAAIFCLSGVGFYLFIASLTPYPVRYLPLAVGAMTLSGILGMVSIVTPAGLGVREGVLVGLLQFTMPVELAVLVSVAARVWATAVDLLLVAGCLAYDYGSGDRLLAAALRGQPAGPAATEPSGALDSGGP